MSIVDAALRLPCTVSTPTTTTTTDEYGDVVPAGPPIEVRARCWVTQAVGAERTVGEQTVVTTWEVFLPAGTPVSAQSRIILDAGGPPLEAVEEPRVVRSPLTGSVDHIEVSCRAVT